MFSFDKGHGSFGVPAEFVSDNLQATKVVMGKFFFIEQLIHEQQTQISR